MTFWERYQDLCTQRNKSPNAVANELGFSNATCTKWKKGAVPSSKSASKVAEYFGVATDYLLGNGNEPKNSMPTDDDIKFALFDGTEGVTDEMYDEVKRFAQFVKQQNKVKTGDENES